jgi:NADH-quinone oxidoreductase subunit M
MTLLTSVIFLPLVAFLIILALPKENHNAIRMFSLIASIAIFLLSLGLISPVWSAAPGKFALETNLSWIASPAINYHIGLDGISLWLVILSTFLTPLCVLVSWRSIDKHIKQFFAFLLLLEFGLVGVFCALDFFLFFVFWEVSLVPMYFLIGIWGHDRRIYAAVKFFLYTMAGSALMLIAIIYLYNLSGTFDYTKILAGIQNGTIALTANEQFYLFLGFFIAFAIKVPLFPLHTWLPDAHVEAPTAGSVMLASVMLKMGTYGLLRFCVPMFPNAARANAGWIVILAIIGIVYGALVAMVQPNMKKLVAYSSVSHLGFVVLGIFSFTQQGFDGAVYQMLNHGICTGALFLLVGFMYERRHSLEISAYGGVATPAPWLATAFMITMLASIGLPTLNNFIGEYLVLQGTSLVNIHWTVFAALGVILSACYMLWLYQRAFFGKASEDLTHHMPDLHFREYAIMVPLIVLMVWMGTYTQSFIPPISASNAVLLGPIDARREIHVRALSPQIGPPKSPVVVQAEVANAR